MNDTQITIDSFPKLPKLKKKKGLKWEIAFKDNDLKILTDIKYRIYNLHISKLEIHTKEHFIYLVSYPKNNYYLVGEACNIKTKESEKLIIHSSNAYHDEKLDKYINDKNLLRLSMYHYSGVDIEIHKVEDDLVVYILVNNTLSEGNKAFINIVKNYLTKNSIEEITI